nr:hypothetical protein GCM10020063_096610 [Dactylosporangium thailandense]
MLHRVHAQHPDLVPEPNDADLDALPGTPLTGDLDTDQQAALARVAAPMLVSTVRRPTRPPRSTRW